MTEKKPRIELVPTGDPRTGAAVARSTADMLRLVAKLKELGITDITVTPRDPRQPVEIKSPPPTVEELMDEESRLEVEEVMRRAEDAEMAYLMSQIPPEDTPKPKKPARRPAPMPQQAPMTQEEINAAWVEQGRREEAALAILRGYGIMGWRVASSRGEGIEWDCPPDWTAKQKKELGKAILKALEGKS